MKTPTYFRDFAKRNELGWDPIRENMVFEAVSFTVSDQKIFKHSSLAQSVEHLTVNQGVVGSSPTGGAFLKYGPMVKRLRHRPFTAVTRVRFPLGSLYADVAQLAEQLTCNQQVIGSIPIVGFFMDV